MVVLTHTLSGTTIPIQFRLYSGVNLVIKALLFVVKINSKPEYKREMFMVRLL